MSDEDLRAIERRWHETGAVHDEARWHTARVRHGLLSAERLELAAWLGAPAAARATGLRLERGLPDAVRYRRAPLRPRELMAWARGLDRFGVEVARRAAIADVGGAIGEAARKGAARDGLNGDAGAGGGDELRVARAWWEAAVGWLVSPASAERARRLDWITRRIATHTEQVWGFGDEQPAVELAVAAARGLRGDGLRVGDWWPATIREHRGRKGGPEPRLLEATHARIVGALAPWALGLRDPLEGMIGGGLDQVEVASACPVAWEAFTATADPAVRRCETCRLDVVDLSALTRAEAEARVEAGRAAGGPASPSTAGPTAASSPPTASRARWRSSALARPASGRAG